jgi:hypothetical protein
MDIVRDTLVEKEPLLVIQGLIGLLVDEVVNPKGKHHYHNHSIDQLTSTG